MTEWIAERHRSSVKISEHGKQRLHTLYMQDKSSKMKILIYTYWKLDKPDNSNSYRTPHRKHWSTVRISEWLHDCTTLFFQKTWLLGSSILNHRNSRLDPCVSRLDPRISKLKAVALRDTRIESQVSSFEYRLTFEQYCIFSRFKEPGSLQFSLEHRIVWGLGTTQNSPKIHMNYSGQLMKFLHT